LVISAKFILQEALTSRPFLPRQFPGYDVYLWLDADTWVQSDDAVEMLVDAAAKADVVLVPEIHFQYSYMYGTNNSTKVSHRAIYQKAYGEELGNTLTNLPVFNAGVFAAAASSPLWPLWQREMRDVINRTGMLNSDQASLNRLIVADSLSVARLPPECNWMCAGALPWWDDARNAFVSPGPLPNTIRILHVSGNILDKDTYNVERVQGGKALRSLLFPGPCPTRRQPVPE
jgi:hypothetical protein